MPLLDLLRRWAGGALRERETFFEHCRSLLLIAGPDGRMRQLNAEWSRVLGWDLYEMVGRPFLEFVHPDDRERTLAEAARLDQVGDTLDFENRYRCKDGSYRWLRWTSRVVEKGGCHYAVAHDVTEQKSLEAAVRRLNDQLMRRADELEALNRELGKQKLRAEAASRSKTQFIANISHELRSPLNPVIGYAEVLLRGVDGPLNSEQLQDLEIIRSNGKHLLNLINDLIDLAKIESGRIDIYPEGVAVSELLLDLRRAFEGEAAKRSLELRIDPAPGALTVWADRQRLRQTLTNLLQNALKFTERGRVALGASEREGVVEFFVQDSGPGIPEGELETVFERFEQSKSLEKVKKGEGMGLGLHLVKHFVELHGGRVRVESRRGTGTTFFVELPKDAEHPRR